LNWLPRELGTPDLLHCDVRDDAQLEALFAQY
jgi:hypothetical protein